MYNETDSLQTMINQLQTIRTDLEKVRQVCKNCPSRTPPFTNDQNTPKTTIVSQSVVNKDADMVMGCTASIASH